MPRTSAGLLVYRRCGADGWEVLLVHPGGPYFANKDDGAWTIPKGEPMPEEDLLACARREVAEETGLAIDGPFRPLRPVKQPGGKTVHAWACETHCDAAVNAACTFRIEWPPRSGNVSEFPEIDRAEFFAPAAARGKIHPAQVALLDELDALLRAGGAPA